MHNYIDKISLVPQNNILLLSPTILQLSGTSHEVLHHSLKKTLSLLTLSQARRR